MKWLSEYRIRLMLVGCAAAVVFGDGRVHADFVFGTPRTFDEPVNSTGIEYFDCISADGLELYIERPVQGGITSNNWDLYVSTRETTNDPWSVPVNLGPTVNSSSNEGFGCLSQGELELYFASSRSGGHGGFDLWVATRPTRSDPWATPENLGPAINTTGRDNTPWITPDGLELYFSSDRPGGHGGVDIWVATRTSTTDTWGEPVNLGPVVNSAAGDYHPCLSCDGLVLFFSDFDNVNAGFRPGGWGQSDMYMTRRKSIEDAWEPPVNLGLGVNTQYYDSQPRVSADGSVLCFTSARPGKLGGWSDIWQAPIIPIVDFNGDGKTDAIEVGRMADHWGTDDGSCDIAPFAWGDGIVDVEDLKALAAYIGQPVPDESLIAHWALDEMAGDVASDSAGVHSGTVMGTALWHPNAGQIAGALELDGTTFVVTEHVRSPADGPFSVLAWIKGGAPGQVIVSQEFGRDWLATDAESGGLMTAVVPPQPRNPTGPLVSDAIVTDGLWHRIALVWDGGSRSLYVDGTLVAADEQDSLLPCAGGLNIGCGTDTTPDSFFTGLIDDVRLYNRAVKP